MRAVTMRKGALRRLELITQIPGSASIAAGSRVLYDGRASAMVRMLHKIESAAGFTIIDRSGPLLAPTAAIREFIEEALQILRCAPGAMAEPAPVVVPAGCSSKLFTAAERAASVKRVGVSLGVEHLVVRLPECRCPGPGRRPRGS
jgi:hypothetical protein